MKRIGIRAVLIVPIIAVMLLTGGNTHAVTPASQAQIEITAGDGPTSPVDPDDPGSPGGGSPTTGSFVFTHISDFEFGNLTISSSQQYSDITTNKPNIQIVDLRGENTGWKVTAKVSRFSYGGSNTLLGASIVIEDAEFASQSVSGAPELTSKPVVLTSGDTEETKVITAAPGNGLGLWVTRLYSKDSGNLFVKLDVPAGSATVGSHTATINWVLENGP